MKKFPCPRCGMLRPEKSARLHETGVWHRNYARIESWMQAGASLRNIAMRLGVSSVRISQAARAAGLRNGKRKAA